MSGCESRRATANATYQLFVRARIGFVLGVPTTLTHPSVDGPDDQRSGKSGCVAYNCFSRHRALVWIAAWKPSSVVQVASPHGGATGIQH